MTTLKSALAAEAVASSGSQLSGAARLTQSLNDFFATQAVGDILKSKVNSRVLPFVVDGGCSVGRHDDLIARIGAVSCRVFDGKIGPGPGNHQRIDPVSLQDRFEFCAVKTIHAHLLDEKVALLRLEALHGGRSPRFPPPHTPLRR